MNLELSEIEAKTINANTIKEMVLNRLSSDGIINEEQVKEYADKWQIILVKTNWFRRWMNVFNKKNETYVYKFVKFED